MTETSHSKKIEQLQVKLHQKKKHVIMLKESIPPQNKSVRFLKSWLTSLLAYSNTKLVILKYQRKK